MLGSLVVDFEEIPIIIRECLEFCFADEGGARGGKKFEGPILNLLEISMLKFLPLKRDEKLHQLYVKLWMQPELPPF